MEEGREVGRLLTRRDAGEEAGIGSRIDFLSCFFPAYNEAENLPALLDEALEVLPRYADRFEVIVVDDGSADATATVVEERARADERIRLVSHERNLGYGMALRTGLSSAIGDAVFFTDADRQFRLDDVRRLLGVWEAVTVAVGYRIKRSDPWYRLVVARVYHWVLRLVFDLRVHDVDCAFKLLGRDALDAMLGELESESAFISPEMLIRAQKKGFRITEVGVPHYPRVAGRAKGVTFRVVYLTIKEIIAMRRKIGAVPESKQKLLSPPQP